MDNQHRKQKPGRRKKRRGGAGREAAHKPLPLTEEGVPAAVPDAPRPSPVVEVSAESRRLYPWLPARVIAGSTWRGPGHLRVRVDETGTAQARAAPHGAPKVA
jgi:hypothetical protein